MMLKKSHGNMYEFIDYVWSPIKGRCSHSCQYCYMKKWGKQPPLHIDEKDLKTNLGEGNFIFVCHTIDLFASDVPEEWVLRVLRQLMKYPKNEYLLQSKNPAGFIGYRRGFPKDVILGTTIETNRDIYNESKAPPHHQRALALAELNSKGFETMVTIEPIFDFDLDDLVELVILANPVWVNIGADSKGHGLPEPSPDKVIKLVKALQEKTDVKLKRNLKRICSDLQIQQKGETHE